MKKISREERKKEIEKLKLPDGIFKLTQGDALSVSSLVKDHCRLVKYYYEDDIKLPEFSFVPLWEGHSSITGFRYENGDAQFFKFYIESPERTFYLGSSVYSAIAEIICWLWTEEEIEDERLIDLSKKLSFPRIDEFLEGIEIANRGTSESQKEWEKEFRESF